MDIFTPAEIQASIDHKYCGSDDSILYNHFLKHLYEFLINFIPMNIAPNVITLTGFLAVVISFLICFFETDFMEHEAPSWVCILNGVCILFYQILDALDGKQARRTGSSSSLGQFFDHGCDAITGCLELMEVAMVLEFGATAKTFYFITLMAVGFLLTTWEEFCIHSFYLGVINGADEGNFMLGWGQILVGIYPPFKKLFQHVGFEYAFVIGFFLTIGLIIYDVVKGAMKDKSVIKPSVISSLPCIITFAIFTANLCIMKKKYINPYFIMLSGLSLQYGGQLLIVAILTGRTSKSLFSIPVILEWIAACIPLFYKAFLKSELFWKVFFWAHLAVMLGTDFRVILGFSRGLHLPVFTIKKKEE